MKTKGVHKHVDSVRRETQGHYSTKYLTMHVYFPRS